MPETFNVMFEIRRPYRQFTMITHPQQRVRHMSNIVIYEENDLMRALLEEWLSEAGYRVWQPRRTTCTEAPWQISSLSACTCPNERARGWCVKYRHCIRNTFDRDFGTVSSRFSASGAIARALGVQRVIAKPLARIDLLAAVRSSSASQTQARDSWSATRSPRVPRNVRKCPGIPAGDQRSRIDVCVGTSESTSCLRNNTRPLGVR